MTSRKGRESVRVELPKETKGALKESDKPMWKVIDESVCLNLGVGDVETEQAFRRRIARLEQRRDDLQNQIAESNDELESVEQDLEDERTRLEQYLDERESIEGIQDRILETLVGTSMSVYSQKADLRDLARREYGHETRKNIEKVISDLKDRRDEQGYAVPDEQLRASANPSANGHSPGRTVTTDDGPKAALKRTDGGSDE